MHPNKRLRLQPRHGSSTSDWFRYDAPGLNDGIFKKTATEVLRSLEKAEKWWEE